MAKSKKNTKPVETLKNLEKKLVTLEGQLREALAYRRRVPYQENHSAVLLGPIDPAAPIDKLNYSPRLHSQKVAARAAVEYNTALNKVVDLKSKISSLRG